MTRMPLYILIFGILITTFAWGFVPDVLFEVPKVVAFQWAVRLLVVLLIFDIYKKKSQWRADGYIFGAILVFSLWAITSSFWGLDLAKSLAGNYYRNDGLITFFSLVGFSLVVSYFWEDSYKRYIAGTFFAISNVLSLVILFGDRTYATFGSHIFLAGFLSVSLPFSIYFIRSFKNKIWYLTLVLPVAVILKLGATSAILTLLLCLIIFLGNTLNRKVKYLFMCILAIFALLISYFWITDYYFQNQESLIAEGRLRIFMNGYQGIIERPLLGYGWSNFDYAFETGNWPIKLKNDVYVDKGHSELFEILVTTGVPGLLIYFYFLFKVFKNLKYIVDPEWRLTLLTIFTLYIFHSQTNVISITEQILFWFLVGLSLRTKSF